MTSKTVSIRLSPETLERLEAMAEVTGRPRAWLMAHAIERYVAAEAWQVEAIQKAVKRLESGEAKFADHGEVEAWLETWGTVQEAGPPVCE